jgi:L-asparaginase
VARIAFIGTGGTISNRGVGPLDAIEYMDRGEILPVDAVLERFPLLATIADIEPVAFATLSSRAVSTSDWIALRRTVTDALARDDIDGAVVTHGTATLEETAYFLSLTVPSPKPVVVVGAQRPAPTVGSDAYPNLVAAVRVAAAPSARGHGCLVVMNDRIDAAREVTKTSNHRLDTMLSPGLGPLGWVDPDGTVQLYRRTLRRHTVDSEFSRDELWRSTTMAPRIDVTFTHAGSDGADVPAYVERGAAAIVISSLAPGVVPPAHEEELLRAHAAGVLLVLASRAPAGRTIARATASLPTVAASDTLSPQSARVLLTAALVARVHPSGLQQVFDTY